MTRRIRSSSFVLTAALALSGCGELFSDAPAEQLHFDAPLEGLTGEQLEAFALGRRAFDRRFGPADGLGPIFNAPSCSSCHPGAGKSHPSQNVIRFGRGEGFDSREFDVLGELGGPQLQDHAIPGYPAETLPGAVVTSERSGPIVAGVGMLELVDPEVIVALADPQDGDGDGISGRVNFVLPPSFVQLPVDCSCPGCRVSPEGCKLLGRFGRKATGVSLLQQAAASYHDDMGITSERYSDDVFNPLVGGPSGDSVGDPELSDGELDHTLMYLRTLRPPLRRDLGDKRLSLGEATFRNIGCAECHVPALATGASPIEALSRVTFFAYTDLLLHDMGDELTDGYPEGEASGREWRTTPLWGLGLVASQLGGEERYLHDGRAKTIERAIELHGGEAALSSSWFLGLGDTQRDALLVFLRSL